MAETTVIIAEDQPLIRDGLTAILTMGGNYNVVAKTNDGLSTIEQVYLHRPDLVLMDIRMPKMDGLEATRRIKAAFPDTKILILTSFDDEQYMWEALREGVNGFLTKGTETAKIFSTIEDCINGRLSYPISIQNRLMQLMGRAEPYSSVPAPPYSQPLAWQRLTAQERNITALLKQGRSNQAIAAELFLTLGTVKNYLVVIYKKLGVSSRSEAIAYLHREEAVDH
ncbi:response regulator transcription factor [Paenibacillus sp. HB172176]|uniref:response regulator transcription factor n=1 Tax=Paenibacillus sp. HB172176 TaxID=2493690 RepID=UPI00143A4EFD|nr:response regulator transcription factor [Paenibacillus sp. HB172176]